MKSLKRFSAIFLALAMVVGMVLPSMLSKAENLSLEGTIDPKSIVEARPKSVELNIHKLVAESYNKGVPAKHNGGKLSEEQLRQIGSTKPLDGVKFKYYKVSTYEKFEEMMKNPANFDTEEKLNDKEKDGITPVTPKNETDATKGGLATVTLADDEKGEGTYYWFIESERPATVTEAKAVPFGIALPLTVQGNKYLNKLHVYPKNVEKKINTTKDFDKQGANGANIRNVGNDTTHNKVGELVPFKVESNLPQGANFKRLVWSDIMTKGLTYNKGSLVIKFVKGNGTEQLNLVKDTDYTVKENESGFDLKVTAAGVSKINEALKTDSLKVTLTYDASLNGAAVPDKEELNNVRFDYNNNPAFDADPTPTTPSNNQIKVTKTWADGKEPETKPEVTYYLYKKGENAEADKVVDYVVLDGKSGYDHTFSGLEADGQYYVREIVKGYEATYGGVSEGNIALTNNKNPEQNKPEPKKVVTYGKKFVKTGENDARLSGAEFVIKSREEATKGKFLKRKSTDDIEQAKAAYESAQDAYLAAVKTDAPDKDTKKAQRDKAYVAMKIQWEFTTNEGEAYKFKSGDQGQFEVIGLDAGNYSLVEKTAPEGYALLSGEVPFSVTANTYTTEKDGINYVDGKTDEGTALKVENKKVTIPQTGGIGALIFAVAGIALMGFAAYSIKRNSKED